MKLPAPFFIKLTINCRDTPLACPLLFNHDYMCLHGFTQRRKGAMKTKWFLRMGPGRKGEVEMHSKLLSSVRYYFCVLIKGVLLNCRCCKWLNRRHRTLILF